MARPIPTAAKKKPIVSRCLWLIALCSGGVSAQTLSPDEAVRLALSRPEVEARAAADIAEARSHVTAARTWPNPELSVEQERGRGAIADSTETSIVLSQTVDLSGRRSLDRRAAELGLRAAESQTEAQSARIRVEVLRHYFEAAAAQQIDAALGETATALAELRRVAARRREAGDLSGFESQRIDQAATRMELRREQQRARLAGARERLAAWVGPEARSATLQADALPAALATTESASATQLALLRARVEAAEAREAAASRQAIPVTIGLGQKRFETAQARDDSLIVQASVPLPIFDRGRANRERARAQADAARASYAIAEREVESRRTATLAEAARLDAAARRYRDDVLPQARTLTRIATASFAEGELDLVGLLETLDAQAGAAEEAADLSYRARLARLDLLNPPTGDLP
jgi:cobalt-zinc-cadmium efflux system outer membrane protein